nr:uncharacterized protein LOC111503173 [Leptinotarsa decemlineata]
MNSQTDLVGKNKMNTKKPEGDIGKHYERKITALIALKCLLRNDIHDFWLTTNHSGIEKFDDLVLHVEFKDKRKEIFFMQLKHKQKGDKPIVVEMFKTNQKDFCLEMYQNAYESIIKNEEFLFANNISKDTDMFFVLYNNCKVEIMSKDSSKLRFDKLEQKYFRSFISSNSSEDVSTEYTITDSETDAEFLKRFYFFAGQLHLTEVPNEIAKLVGLDIDFVINILNFFYDFADSNNTIQKLHKLNLKSKLLGYIFSVFVPPNKCSKNYHILSVINTFNVTLIHEEYSEVVIWSDIISSMKEYYKEESLELDNWEVALPMELQNKFRTKLNFTNEVNINTKHLYFHMVAQRLLPFYIETKNIFFNTFFNEIMTKLDIITVIRDTKNFFGKNPEFPNAQNEGDFKLLKTVDDLDENQYLTLTKRVQVSLQGKQYVQLSDLVDNDNRDLRKTFSIDTLIHLLDKNLRFGSSGIKAEIYIERRLKIPILNESILKYGPCIFVICGNYSPKNFVSVPLEVGVAIFRHLNTVMKLPCEFIPLPVLTVNRSLDRSIMKEVKELAKNRFYCILQFFDEKDGSQRFILKDTNGSLEKIEYDILANEYYLLNDDELFESTKNSNINVICNNAGMGKTMFLNRIRNKFSPTEWVIHLALGKYSSEIKKIESYTEFIEFLSKMDWQTDDDKKDTTIIEILFHHHIERRKMVLLIDDYEEINDRKLLKILKEGMENGLRIWMVSRPLLKMELEENFGVLSMELDEFTVADQNKFFRLFFSSKNDSGDVEKKMSLVEKTREKFQNSFIGICQQTMMLAVVINSNEHVFDDRIRIHELYERFIDIHIPKDSKKTRFILRTMSKLALYSFFSKAVLEMLFDWDEFVCDLEIFNEENPKPALVMESRIESIPVFSHKTYAEFLAAKWLADIVIKQIKKETPFDISEAFKLLYCQELTNVRLFFDNILTTDNPLLSSIINNDIPKDILWNSGNETDILGRTTYHMLLSYGKRYIIHTDLEARNTLQNIEERAVFQMAQQLITIEVPDFVPKSESNYTENNVFLFGFHEQLLKEDILLHKNAIEYALMSGSLEKLDSVLKTEFLISNMPTEFLFRNIEFDTLFITLLHCIKNNFNMLFLKLVSIPNICNSLQKVRENPSGKSLLHLAVESKNLQAVRTLLLNYNNIESWGVDNEENTPLHLVNDFEDPSILKDFFALGKYTAALVNRKNIKGFSHLHCFASRGNEIWVKKLLNIPGVKANVKCIQGRTPFILSVMEGHIKVAIILKNNRAKINKGDKNNNTALHYAVLRGDFECTEQLLEWGVEVNAKNSHGLTPLMQAASRGYLDIMVRLLLSGAIINLMDRNGWTALHYAIMEKHYDIIQLLLREGADTKKITKDGQTPLITACIHNVPKAVEMLIDCGRDVRINYHSLPEGGNALDIARRRGHLSCARPLVGLTKLRIPRTVLPSRTAPQNRRNRSRSERISHQSEDSDRFQRLILAQNLTVSVDIQVRMPSEI